jgi:hypothetical protein
MLQSARTWRKRRYQYTGSKPKLQRFPAKVQPHAQYRVTWVYDHATKAMVKQSSGCDCSACMAYLRLLAKLNPERFQGIINPPMDEEPKFFKPKGLSADEHARRNRGKSINRFSIL